MTRDAESNMGDNNLVVITIEIYAAGGWRGIQQKAVKDWDSSQSEITEACLTSMGFAIPASRKQNLTWAYKARRFRSDFVVVASAKQDVVLGSADCEGVYDADQPGAFPTTPEKKSLGEWFLLCNQQRLTWTPRVEEGAGSKHQREQGASAGGEERGAQEEARGDEAELRRHLSYSSWKTSAVGRRRRGRLYHRRYLAFKTEVSKHRKGGFQQTAGVFQCI